jgi:hypothetical protein
MKSLTLSFSDSPLLIKAKDCMGNKTKLYSLAAC